MFFSFFLAIAIGLFASADGYLSFQERLTDIFEEKKGALVRVFGEHLPENSIEEGEPKVRVDVATGFFISREGLIMTIANVVEDARRYWVEYGGKTYNARLLGYDGYTNVAILKIQGLHKNDSFVQLNESTEVAKPATLLLAITCKLGLEPGPSMGMVSGWHTAFFDQIFPTTFMRSTIPSDGGEAGSPVFDLNGHFVGMITASVESIRSSFIIPTRAIVRIRDDLLFSGKASYGYLGVEIDKKASIQSGSYIIIGRALEGGPAYEAGVKRGDKLLEFNGTKINHVSDLHNAIFFARPGQNLTMRVLRGDDDKKLLIKVGEHPQETLKESLKPIEKREQLKTREIEVEEEIRKVPEVVERAAGHNKGGFWHDFFNKR